MLALCGIYMSDLKVSRIIFMCAMLFLTACDQQITPWEAEAREVEATLSWLDDADPIQMALNDFNSNSIKFHQVCSYSCGSVGIGYMNGKRCFPQIAHVPMQGTSDVILSDEHKRLMEVAHKYATRYNTEVVRLLREKGASRCDLGVDWNAAHNSLTDFVWSLNDDISKQGHVGAFPEKKTNQKDFTVLLPEKITEELTLKICISLAEYLPNETVSVEVKARQNIKNIQVIQCKNGRKINAT